MKVSIEYADFTNIFILGLASKLPKHTEINNHAIKLANCQHPLYELIYSLKAIELKSFKAYIKTNLANGFIKPFKSPTSAFIFFD